MSRLSYEEITNIASEKGLHINNPDDYQTLKTLLSFECTVCKKTFISDIETIRNSKFKCPLCESQDVHIKEKPPLKPVDAYRIIGFDQATENFGVSVYDNNKLVYYACIHFRGLTDERLTKIYLFISMICSEWNPDFVMFEDIQLQQNGFNGYKTFKVLAELIGVVTVALRQNGIQYGMVLNKVWQAEFMIAGSKRDEQKRNVISRVQQLFNINVSDDIADAILIGKYACKLKQQSEVKTIF